MENLLILSTFTKEKTWAWNFVLHQSYWTAALHYQTVTILHRNNCFWYGAGLIKDYSWQTLHPGIERHFNPLALPPPLTSLNSKPKMAAFRQLLKKVSFDQFSFYNIFRPMKRDKIKLIHFRKKKSKNSLEEKDKHSMENFERIFLLIHRKPIVDNGYFIFSCTCWYVCMYALCMYLIRCIMFGRITTPLDIYFTIEVNNIVQLLWEKV